MKCEVLVTHPGYTFFHTGHDDIQYAIFLTSVSSSKDTSKPSTTLLHMYCTSKTLNCSSLYLKTTTRTPSNLSFSLSLAPPSKPFVLHSGLHTYREPGLRERVPEDWWYIHDHICTHFTKCLGAKCHVCVEVLLIFLFLDEDRITCNNHSCLNFWNSFLTMSDDSKWEWKNLWFTTIQ